MNITLNDLFEKSGINPEHVIVFRHRPQKQPKLMEILPLLAAARPKMFNAYQQQQTIKVEKVMQKLVGKGYVASFIGQISGEATFVGLYSIKTSKPLTYTEYWKIQENKELRKYGMEGFTKKDTRNSVLWFDLQLVDFCKDWQGKLIVKWTPPERSWWRRAHRNEMPVIAILKDSYLDRDKEWYEIELSWDGLQVLPSRLKSRLSEWRGVYYIFDKSDGKGYVGSAYGKDNILGRWQHYAKNPDGGNNLLKGRDRENFIFTILERTSPDAAPDAVIQCENSWKERLHTREYGLNDN